MWEVVRSIAVNFWMTVAEMSPYLLLGFFIAGLLSVLVSQRLVERHLGGRGIWPLFKASIFGIPLPLCSCGVIPVATSLRRHGASKGSTISFLLSTPQTGVDSIMVTLSLLGPVIAVFRPLAALVTGLLGGTLVDFFARRKPEEQAEKVKCEDACCTAGSKKSRLAGGMKYGFVTLPADIGRSMLVGLAIAAGIAAFVPEGFFAEYVGTGISAMLLMMVLGVPIYVCATASVPIAAALIAKGVTPGAALVFLMTGPATNAASFTTIWKVLGHRTALLYLASVVGCALAAGLTLNYIARGIDIAVATKPAWMLPAAVKHTAAVVLLLLLAAASLRKKGHGKTEAKEPQVRAEANHTH